MLENEFDKRAFSEVIEIINHSDKDIVEKIPKHFIKFLYENMDNEYNVNIDFSNENWDETVLEETNVILALIYRDYIVSPEEREELLIEEKKEQEENERKLREKYNTDNLFKKKNIEMPDELVEETQLIEVKEYPWYKRLFKKILAIFNIHKK